MEKAQLNISNLNNLHKPSDYTFEERLFNNILLIGLTLSGIFTLNAIFVLNDMSVMIIDLLVGVVIGITYLLSIRYRNYKQLTLPVLITVLCLLTYLWITDSNGYLSSNAYVYFVMLSTSMILTRGWSRFFIVFLLILDITILYAYQFIYPEQFSYPLVVSDMITKYVILVISLLATAYLFNFLKNNYDKEHALTLESHAELDSKNKIIQKQHDELVTYNEQLESKVAARTIELQKLNGELIQQNRQLEQYNYITSHNLRGPVMSMKGLLSIYDQESMSDINLEITRKLSDQILNLENILSDLSNIIEVKREQNIKKDWLSIADFLDKTRLLLQSEIDITHTVIDDTAIEVNEIYAAPAFLQSILYNLLHNAIKYAHPNRNPHIRLSSKRENQSIILQISDNGLGIDMKYAKDKIFGLYQRFHQHHKGKGMGLYLVRQQVEAMGGKIQVDSQPDEGTTFQIKFPNK